jgi:hypothetical protein
MPEIKSVPENFVELPQEKIDAVPYKDKKREKARKVSSPKRRSKVFI